MRYRYIYKHKTGLTKVKTKLAIAFTTLGLGVGGVIGSVAIFGAAHATSTPVTVTTTNPQGWAVVQDNSGTTGGGSFVTGPGTPPLGAGSAELYTNNSNDGYFLAGSLLGGTKLADITSLSYSTYVQTGNNTIAPSLQFDVSQDVSDSSTYQGRLVYEPYQNDTVTDRVWQSWNALNGEWWLSHSSTQFNNDCSQSSPCTFSELTRLYPNIGVRNLFGGVVGFKAGSGWTVPFVGNIDAFTVGVNDNDTTYNFEPSPTSFQVKPWTYDPGKTRAVSAAWVTHEGLADAGNSNHALYLTKKTTTATNAASGATVTFSGQLNSLGFDYRGDGHCGAGAPRFNVYTSDGVTHFFGCVYGTHTSLSDGWTRVEQTPSEGFPAVTPNETVTGMDVVFDEGTDQGQGLVYLDNIQVNGVMAGKPGLAQ
jgi:hypothetical protein